MPIPVRNKLTQMQQAREHFVSIAHRIDGLADDLDKLYNVLGEAQNSKECGGMSDESISEETWTRLNEIAMAGRDLCWKIRKIRDERS